MPFSNVPTTTVDILTPEIDYFTWPSISGEKYPPTLGAGWAYGMIGGLTCIQNVAAASNSTVTYPNIPLIKPTSTAFSGYTASIQFRSTGTMSGGSGWVYTLTFPGNLQLRLTITSNDVTCVYTPANALSGGVNQPMPTFNDGVFHTFAMVVSGTSTSTATVQFLFDGTVLQSFTSANVTLGTTTGQFIVNRNTSTVLLQYASSPYMLYS